MLKNSTYKTSSYDTLKAKVVSLDDCDEKKVFDWGEIELPVKVTVEVAGQKIEAPSKNALNPRKWDKYFYVSNKGYVQYTQDSMLTAVYQIYKTTLKDEPKEVDLNKALIGFEFECVFGENDNGVWINWVETFKLHGVRVPDLGQTVDAENKKAIEKVEKVDEDDLPF